MLETIKISEEEATIRRLMDSVFMEAAEADRLRQENKKLAVDSTVLDKIVKIIGDWGWDPDFIHLTMDEISDAIDERGD
jgi:hypothetical protein